MVDKSKEISINKQCKILNLNKNFLYFSPKGESPENLLMMQLMDKQYFETPFYGCRKMKVWLELHGYDVNIKKVRRLMKLINWQTIYREPRTTISNKEHIKHPCPKGQPKSYFPF